MTKYPTIELPPTREFAHLNFEDFYKSIELYNILSNGRSVLLTDQSEPVIKQDIFPTNMPLFHHYDCICPECKIVSWIQIENSFLTEDQPFCPVCRKELRSDINSIDKMMYVYDDDFNNSIKALFGVKDLDIPFLNKLHV